eukprot:6028090-Pyramimonas_sp.AAC.1
MANSRAAGAAARESAGPGPGPSEIKIPREPPTTPREGRRTALTPGCLRTLALPLLILSVVRNDGRETLLGLLNSTIGPARKTYQAKFSRGLIYALSGSAWMQPTSEHSTCV